MLVSQINLQLKMESLNADNLKSFFHLILVSTNHTAVSGVGGVSVYVSLVQ